MNDIINVYQVIMLYLGTIVGMILTICGIAYLMVNFIAIFSRWFIVRFQIVEEFLVFVHIRLLIPEYIDILKKNGYEKDLRQFLRVAKKFSNNICQMFKNKNNF